MHASFHEGKCKGAIWIGLHGSGLDERAMPPFIRRFDLSRAVLSLRGDLVCENGFAFFQRRPDRSIDHMDLLDRARRLQDWLTGEVTARYPDRPLWLCGYSNGAIMATALLSLRNLPVERAALYRPQPIPHLAGTNAHPPAEVLVVGAGRDPRRMPGDAEAVAEQLAACGHSVRHHQSDAGHAPEDEDVQVAADWLTSDPV